MAVSRSITAALVLLIAEELAGSAKAAPAPLPPDGWRMELVAQAPDIRHPSVVCAAPDGRVFVAEDPMDISSPHADAAEGRILCFFPDGHRTLFAEKLHAVFGMQYIEGKLYVLHNPQFSVFTDENGVGKDRVELVESMNPNPWALDWNDHVPANFRLAMDGYLYAATGDKGLFGAVGRDGKRLDMHGGGIFRMRPDGTDLQQYCSGTRNILDVALNDEDAIFTYDNTDEHDWMGRLTHMVDGGFYGYPYDFIPRRDYTLWMMHDFGGGAATGTLCYNEDALPEEYRNNLFLADFGKQQILRVIISAEGATYRVKAHEEFFKNPPPDFRPVGIAFGADAASIYICDWQHRDTKETVVVGRLWKAVWTGTNLAAAKPAWYLAAASGRPFQATSQELLAALAHPSKSVRLQAQRQLARRKETRLLAELARKTSAPPRARWHAIWALDACGENRLGREATLAAAKDGNAFVRRQAIRQLGSRGVREAAPVLKAGLSDQDPGARFEAATALGRMGSAQAAPALLDRLEEKDAFVRFSVFTAMNRIGRADSAAWKTLAKGLESSQPTVRQGTEFALRNTYDPVLLDLLIALAGNPRQPFETRDAALRLCIELHHQPAEWKGEWWAYHPALAAPQERDVAWTGTPRILALLRRTLADSDPRFRLAAANGLAAAGDVSSSTALRSSFEQERAPEVRRAIITALGKFKDPFFASRLSQLLPEAKLDSDTLSVAVRAAGNIGGDELKAALLNLAADTRIDSVVRIEAINALSLLKSKDASVRLELLLKENHPAIRVASLKAIAQISGMEASPLLRSFLTNGPTDLRKEAVIAVGKLHERSAIPELLIAWHSPETRAEALEALSQNSDPRALEAYLDGLASTNPTVREQSRKALTEIRQDALPLIESKASSLNVIALGELRELYKGDARAERGILFTNQVITLGLDDYERYGSEQAGDAGKGQRIFFDETGVACIKCHAVAGHGGAVGPDLTLIGAQFPRKDLIEHVLYPSRVVREGYQQVMVETRDGETSSGIIKSETGDSLTLLNVEGKLASIPKSTIVNRLKSSLSLMPEGLQAGLSLAQFADLLAFLESRRADPRQPVPEPPPPGFVPLLNGRDLAGWREVPAGTKRLTMAANEPHPPAHWRVNQATLEHDGIADDLWTERQFENFVLRLDWRWVDRPVWENFPLINRDGVEETGADGKPMTERVLDAGDSGVLLRGLYKAQANLFCYPVGSGEVWEYRTDPALSTDQRRALTPSRQADRPLGDWNRMEITVRGDRLTVVLNGEKVITDAELPGLPSQGPIGLQHEHGRIQFANIFVQDLP